MYKPATFKEWQINKNVIDCATAIERFLTTKCQTVGLLQLVLATGWRISKIDSNKVKWVERDLQCKQDTLNNLYLSTKQNKVHIYQFYESEFNKDFITVRLNINVDEYDKVYLV